jgi:hypothetical protein
MARNLCLSPDVLTVGLLAIPLISIMVIMGGVSQRVSRLAPEIVLAAFLLLLVGGFWMRDLRRPPGFSAEQQSLLRVTTSELANGPPLVLPGQLVQLSLGPESDTRHRDFPNLQVLGMYGEDGHSVAYTGEIPENLVLSVPGAEFDDLVVALNANASAAIDKQPLYLQGQVGPVSTATPVFTPAI